MNAVTYYTRHNTLVAMLTFFALLALTALIIRQVRMRRQQWHPYFKTKHEPKFNCFVTNVPIDQWPMPGSYDDIMGQMAEAGRELHDKLITEWINGPSDRFRDMWSEMQDAWACES